MPRKKDPVQGTPVVRHSYNLRPRAKSEEPQGCVICLGTRRFKKYEKCSCGHSFHTNCINEWLKSNDCCPLCRQPLKPTLQEKPELNYLRQHLEVVEQEQRLLFKTRILLDRHSNLLHEEQLRIENQRVFLQGLDQQHRQLERVFNDKVAYFNRKVDFFKEQATVLYQQQRHLNEQKQYLLQQIRDLESQSTEGQ